MPARLTAAAAAVALTAGVVLFGGGAGTAPADPTGGEPTGPGGGQLKAGTVPAAYVGLVARAGSMCPEMPAPVIAAQVQTESAWNPRAVSPVGAQGIAQFMPGTWAAAGRDWSGNGVADVWDPADAIPSQGGFDCSIVAQLRAAVAAGRVRGDLTDLALAGYNAGAGAVLAYGGVPPFPETRAYVTRIRQLALTYTAPAGPPSAPGLPGAPAGSFAAAEIAAATSQLGVPYVYGGGGLDGPSGDRRRGSTAPGWFGTPSTGPAAAGSPCRGPRTPRPGPGRWLRRAAARASTSPGWHRGTSSPSRTTPPNPGSTATSRSTSAQGRSSPPPKPVTW